MDECYINAAEAIESLFWAVKQLQNYVISENIGTEEQQAVIFSNIDALKVIGRAQETALNAIIMTEKRGDASC